MITLELKINSHVPRKAGEGIHVPVFFCAERKNGSALNPSGAAIVIVSLVPVAFSNVPKELMPEPSTFDPLLLTITQTASLDSKLFASGTTIPLSETHRVYLQKSR